MFGQLFIFGFSRGAYTARVLANFIARVGMFSKAFSWEFKLAWKAYVAGPKKLDPYLTELNKNVSTDREKYDANSRPGKLPFVPRVYKPKIKVVGCWDTVASLGLPWHPISNPGGVSGEYQFFDGSLAPGQLYRSKCAPRNDISEQVSSTRSTPWLWTSVAGPSPQICGTFPKTRLQPRVSTHLFNMQRT